MYNKIEKFVIDTFTKAGKSRQIEHFLRTVYWIKELRPNADEALLIAAVAHDIERGFRKDDMYYLKKSKGVVGEEFLRPHQERGAEIVAGFLKENGAEKELIERVKHLVSRHEEGGDEGQNLLKDADSISFFENNANIFVKEKVQEIGKEKVKKKFEFMFERITSEKAKEICREWYKKALGDLEAV